MIRSLVGVAFTTFEKQQFFTLVQILDDNNDRVPKHAHGLLET